MIQQVREYLKVFGYVLSDHICLLIFILDCNTYSSLVRAYCEDQRRRLGLLF